MHDISELESEVSSLRPRSQAQTRTRTQRLDKTLDRRSQDSVGSRKPTTTPHQLRSPSLPRSRLRFDRSECVMSVTMFDSQSSYPFSFFIHPCGSQPRSQPSSSLLTHAQLSKTWPASALTTEPKLSSLAARSRRDVQGTQSPVPMCVFCALLAWLYCRLEHDRAKLPRRTHMSSRLKRHKSSLTPLREGRTRTNKQKIYDHKAFRGTSRQKVK
jgi:hypothetical protein